MWWIDRIEGVSMKAFANCFFRSAWIGIAVIVGVLIAFGVIPTLAHAHEVSPPTVVTQAQQQSQSVNVRPVAKVLEAGLLTAIAVWRVKVWHQNHDGDGKALCRSERLRKKVHACR